MIKSSIYKNIISKYKNDYIYKNFSKFINKSEGWNIEKINNYQWEKLKALINHCYLYVPYYKNIFKHIGATPEDIKTIEDYKKIPTIDKDTVRKNINLLVSTNIKKSKLIYFTTGGSTGQPLGIYKTNDLSAIELAFMHSQWKRVGFSAKSKVVVLRGDIPQNGKLFHKAKLSNIWIFSSFQMNLSSIEIYHNMINEIKPDFLHVYPSSLNILIDLLKSRNLKFKFSPKAVFCGSEPILSFQRNMFETFLKTRVYSWLGSAEASVLAGECEYTSDYHVFPQYSYTEVLKNINTKNIGNENEGEIIGTYLHNYAMPLLRYKTGDYALFSDDYCKFCKRNYQIIKEVKGRIQDIVYRSDGTSFPIGPAIFGIHEDYWDKVKNIQISQEKIGHIIIKINTRYKNDNDFVNKINLLFNERFKGQINFKIIFTEKMKKSKTGKHILLDQRVR